MIRISKQEVARIASISSIALPEVEIPSLVNKLEQVLGYAQRVKELAEGNDIRDPMMRQHNIFRDDSAKYSNAQELLSRAPQSEGEFFVVPLILDSAE